MKPYQFLFATAAWTAALGAAGSVVLPSLANASRTGSELGISELPPLPLADGTLIAAAPSRSDRLWVKVRSTISIEELANELRQDESALAKLNDVNEDHAFKSGDWLVLPTGASKKAKTLASIDTSELRRTPPLVAAPPEPVAQPRIRFGDNTLAQVAERYNLSIQELVKLNPGLRAARNLVVGTPIRVAQAATGRSRLILGLKPSASGGLSWPDQPGFGESGNDSFGDTGWIWPTKGIFSSGYGWRWGRMHQGIDIANNVGTPIHAARSGQVVSAGWNDGGYGYLVEIRHADGSLSRYAHNSRILVTTGQQVDQGTVISQMGSTGRSTGPHLHFEIRPAGRGAVNPLQLLPPRA